MKRIPGDIWIEEKWSFDTPSHQYYEITEMTGAGCFNWSMHYLNRETAIIEIEKKCPLAKPNLWRRHGN